MSYQFAHIETYSRQATEPKKTITKEGKTRTRKGKLSVRDVVAEAKREDGNAPHVEAPQSPRLVFGQSLEQMERDHDTQANQSKNTLRNGKTRAIRSTQSTLLAGVLSHPGEGDGWSEEAVSDWQSRCIDWLKETYGDQLKTVVRHDDESHPHLHFYVLPSGPEMKANDLHPGQKAKSDFLKSEEASGLDDKTRNRLGDRKYKEAMRAWQDDYFRKVGLPCGLERFGPKRQRKSRSQHLEAKEAQKAEHQAKLERQRQAEEADRKAQEAELSRKKVEASRNRANDQLLKVRKSLKREKADLKELVDSGFFLRVFAGLNLWLAGAKSEMQQQIDKVKEEGKKEVDRVKASASKQIKKLKEDLKTRENISRKDLVEFNSLSQRVFNVENALKIEKLEHQKTKEDVTYYKNKWADLDNKNIQKSSIANKSNK